MLVPWLYEHRLVLLDPVPDVVSLQRKHGIFEKLGSGNSTRWLGLERLLLGARAHAQSFCTPPACQCKKFKQIITTRKRSLGQGNIFRSVCQEFCRGGGVVVLVLSQHALQVVSQHALQQVSGGGGG